MSTIPRPLQNKVVLITGAARRLGAAIVRVLHREGMNVLLHYHASQDDALALQAELQGERTNSVHLTSVDLLDPAGPGKLIAQANEVFGQLDAIINNASSFYPTPVGATTEAQWQDLIGVNLKAPFFLAQAGAPLLAQTQGAIVNITDIYAERALAHHPVYAASKAGLVSLTRSLARELAPDVRVNAVAPGAVLWPEDSANETVREQLLARTPLQRIGNPGDIAYTVLFLLRDAPFVTGQVINVDGGRSIVP
jgi:pteridine reductase